MTAMRNGTTPSEPDAHGQAALLLAESILHTLVESGAMTFGQAIAAARAAAEVKVEVAAEAGESKKRMNESIDLLNLIASSLETDANRRGSARPRLV